ncbi:MAG TPA: ATP-binding protein, partial [Candidatus Limnocylindria bacterium]|nr:ATP-binding protein [Candidatus Limnocylindria bacterium]
EREREERATALYLLTRQLVEGQDFAELLGRVIAHFGAVFDAEVAILLADTPTSSELVPYPFGSLVVPEKELGVADWAYRNSKPAGYRTDTLPSATALYMPLVTPGGCLGVVGLRPRQDRDLTLQQQNLLENFVQQTALVIDRQRLRDADQMARLLTESERLSKSLLDSVSHELRTPLAAITSAAGGLADMEEKDNPQLRKALTGEIREASERLNRLVGNLLDMTRLESGRMQARMEWCDVADLVGVAARHLTRQMKGHHLVLAITPQLPLVRMDFVLMEEALVNLMLNATLHTPPGSEIRVAASIANQELSITVSDNGPGIPSEVLPKLFSKFYRAPGAPAGGSGLGLSIVKGFVEAQGGTVKASNRPSGGAMFEIRLPATEPPMLPPETA